MGIAPVQLVDTLNASWPNEKDDVTDEIHKTEQEYGGPSTHPPPLQAAYRVVHRYPAGIDAHAAQLGRSPKYLIRTVSELLGAKLNIHDAQKTIQITGDHEMVHVMAKMLGRKIIPLPPLSDVSSDPAYSPAALQFRYDLNAAVAELEKRVPRCKDS